MRATHQHISDEDQGHFAIAQALPVAVWRPQHPAFRVPYAPAVVELDEGAFLMSAVIGCEDGDLEAGMRVKVEFHPADDTITLPYFRPVVTSARS